MQRIQKFRQSMLVGLLLMAMLMQATGVAFAEDSLPPEEPVATEEAPADSGGEAADEVTPTEEVNEPTEEVSPTEEVTDPTEEAAPAEEAAVEEVETVADVVEALDESGAVLVDESGEALSLAEAATEELLEVADPWFEDPLDATLVIAYQSDCTGWVVPAGYAGGTCNVSATPIQAAINAAPAGATVHLEAGTFVEQVTIDKDLTLQGAGAGTSIIQAPNSLAINFNNGQNNRAIIYVSNDADVTIDGVTVDGDGNGNGNYRFIGIAYHNAGGTISNSEITNIMETPFSGTQHGVAIYVYNADGTARTIDIENNTITDYQKNGISIIGANLTANVTDNTITGAGPTTTIAQNGVQFSSGAGGTITGNTITGNFYGNDSWTSTGILLYGVTTVDVEGNTIADNQSGIYLYGGEANITGNEVSGSDWGILFYSPTSGGSTGSATGNDITGNEIGVYTDNPAVPVTGNNFSGNTDGLQLEDYYGIGGTLDGTNNFWGCAEGPGNPGCDTVIGDVNTDPFATELIVPPAPAAGGNDAGDEEDDDDFGLPHTGAPYFSWSLLNADSMTTFAMWNGGLVMFPPMADSMARVNVWMDDLPLALPEGYAYQTGLNIELMQGGVQVYNSGDSLYSVAFALPEGVSGDDAAILFFDPVAGEWLEVPTYLTEDGFIVAYSNIMGLYVLATH